MARLSSVLAYGSRQLKRAYRKWQMAHLARQSANADAAEEMASDEVLYWAACEGYYERAWLDMATYRAQYQTKSNWHPELSWSNVEA